MFTTRPEIRGTFFLRHAHHGLNLQEAIDMPMRTTHLPSAILRAAATPRLMQACAVRR